MGVWGRRSRPREENFVYRAGGEAASTIHRYGFRKGHALPYLLQSAPLPGMWEEADGRVPYAGTIANTRSGLPLPSTIFSGAAITIAPVAGS